MLIECLMRDIPVSPKNVLGGEVPSWNIGLTMDCSMYNIYWLDKNIIFEFNIVKTTIYDAAQCTLYRTITFTFT